MMALNSQHTVGVGSQPRSDEEGGSPTGVLLMPLEQSSQHGAEEA